MLPIICSIGVDGITEKLREASPSPRAAASPSDAERERCAASSSNLSRWTLPEGPFGRSLTK